MAGNYLLPTAMKNRNVLADSIHFGQFPYKCEIDTIESEVSYTEDAENVRHVSIKGKDYAQSDLIEHIAGYTDPLDKRIVWFLCKDGVPKINLEDYPNLNDVVLQPTRDKYSNLLQEFLAIDWLNDDSVLSFYRKYGPLWIDQLCQHGLRRLSHYVDESGNKRSQVKMEGEWIYAAKAQADLVKVIVELYSVLKKNNEDELYYFIKRLRRDYCEVDDDTKRGQVAYFRAPAQYVAHKQIKIPNDQFCRKHLQYVKDCAADVLTHWIDLGLKGVKVSLERLNHHESNEYSHLPLMVYEPTNLIELIYLELAIMCTSRNDYYTHRCPVCGDFYFLKRKKAIWHYEKCRQTITRALRDEAKGLSAEQKVLRYQQLLLTNH